MKIALASARIVDRDIEHNLKQMERFMRQAKAENATLVCFGEAFLQGFGALTWNYEKDREIAISTSSKEFSYIKSLTKSIGIDVMFGYNELSGDRIYSSCALVSGGEIVHNYRRISRGWKEYWKTDDHYREGSSVEIFEYGNKKCAIALCGDLWDHPERFALGEDVLFWGVYVSWTSEDGRTAVAMNTPSRRPRAVKIPSTSIPSPTATPSAAQPTSLAVKSTPSSPSPMRASSA